MPYDCTGLGNLMVNIVLPKCDGEYICICVHDNHLLSCFIEKCLWDIHNISEKYAEFYCRKNPNFFFK